MPWLQSNMEKTVSYTWNSSAEIAAADHPSMRLFQRQSLFCPDGKPPPGVTPDECGPKGPWHKPSRALKGSCIYPGSPGKNCPKPRRTWTKVTPWTQHTDTRARAHTNEALLAVSNTIA